MNLADVSHELLGLERDGLVEERFELVRCFLWGHGLVGLYGGRLVVELLDLFFEDLLFIWLGCRRFLARRSVFDLKLNLRGFHEDAAETSFN